MKNKLRKYKKSSSQSPKKVFQKALNNLIKDGLKEFGNKSGVFCHLKISSEMFFPSPAEKFEIAMNKLITSRIASLYIDSKIK